jgi:general secretion pathway protein L
MTPQQVLNADLGTIGRWLADGLRWWGEELAAMAPSLGARAAKGRLAAEIDLTADPPIARLWRGEQMIDRFDAPPSKPRRVDLRLTADQALVHDLPTPALASGDLRRLLALNLDRYTPFAPDQVHFGFVMLDAAPDATMRRARLALTRRETAAALLDAAERLKLEVGRMVPATADGGPAPDLGPAAREERQGGAGRRRLTVWWTLCGVLVAANLAALIARDMAETRRLSQALEMQRPTVALVNRLKASVDGERAQRERLLARRTANDPLRIIDATTRAIPSGQWVQRLEWNGRSLRLVGFKQSDFDLVEALRREPGLSNSRSLLSDMPTRAPNGKEAFDVMADAGKRP